MSACEIAIGKRNGRSSDVSAWNVIDSNRVPGSSGIRYVPAPADTTRASGVCVTPSSSITVAVTPTPAAFTGTSSDRLRVDAPGGRT